MGFRFRKTIRLGKGLRLNLSRRGANIGVSIPGTGITWNSASGGRKGRPKEYRPDIISHLARFGCLGFAGLTVFSVLMVAFGPKPGPSQVAPARPTPAALPKAEAVPKVASKPTTVAPPVTKGLPPIIPWLLAFVVVASAGTLGWLFWRQRRELEAEERWRAESRTRFRDELVKELRSARPSEFDFIAFAESQEVEWEDAVDVAASIYRGLARKVYADGVVTAAERASLATLAAGLLLDDEEAAAIEAEVKAESVPVPASALRAELPEREPEDVTREIQTLPPAQDDLAAIRSRLSAPDGWVSPLGKEIFRSKVAGVTKSNPDGRSRQEIIARYCYAGLPLVPKAEPNNPADPNAVSLWVPTDRGISQVGYFSAERAPEVLRPLAAGHGVRVTVIQVTGGSADKPYRGLNIVVEVSPRPLAETTGSYHQYGPRCGRYTISASGKKVYKRGS